MKNNLSKSTEQRIEAFMNRKAQEFPDLGLDRDKTDYINRNILGTDFYKQRKHRRVFREYYV